MKPKRDAIPLYHQLFLTLRDEIESGRQPLGSLLPTEFEMSSIYGVSRITARRVMQELSEAGLVERRRRTGTQVIYRASVKPIEANIEQAISSLIAFGHGTEVAVVEIDTEPASSKVALSLNLAVGARVIRAVRVRSHDQAPIGEVTSYVPDTLGHVITRQNLIDRPILEVLRDSGIRIGHARQTVESTLSDRALEHTLGLEPRAPVLRIERIVYDEADQPILLTVAQYRGDRYRITLDLSTSNQLDVDIL